MNMFCYNSIDKKFLLRSERIPMQKRFLLFFMAAMLIISATSCSLIEKDATVDMQTVVVEVADVEITKGEIQALIPEALASQEYMYSMFGMAFDRNDPAMIESTTQTVIDTLIEEKVIDKKLSEMKLDTLTEEELATVTETAAATYDSYVSSVKSTYFAETELTGEELDKAIEAELVKLQYPTKEETIEIETRNKQTEKLRAEIIKDVTVTDEEITADYDAKITLAQDTYKNDPNAFGNDSSNGTVYYTPEGYRNVKHILRSFTADDSAIITDLNTQITDKTAQLGNVENTLAELGEKVDGEDTTITTNRDELTATVATLKEELTALETTLSNAKETAIANIMPTVDEIIAKLALPDADFDALIKEYGEDPGMTSAPASEVGYPISAATTNMVEPFVTGSMALANVGDVSAPVVSDFGIHIIKYVSDVTPGATPLENVKDTIKAELLTNKQDTLYAETVQTWVTDANAVVHKDRLK